MTRSPLSRWSLIPMMAAQIASGQEYVSTFLLNRDNDLAQAPSSPNIPPNGTNLEVQGGANIIFFPGGGNSGIVLGSTSSVHNHEAGRIQGNSGSVVAVATYVRGGAAIGGSASMNWRCAPNGPYCPPLVRSDQDRFTDPFDLPSKTGEIRGQPPIYGDTESAMADTLRPVPGGLLTEAICQGGTCKPGIYFATEPDCNGCPTWHPSGAPIRSNNNAILQFTGGQYFERFIFVGGLILQNGTNATLGPGRYVFAGVLDPSTPVFQAAANVTLIGGNGTDAGRLLIFTDFRLGTMRNPPSPSAADIDSYAGQIDGIWRRIQDQCLLPCDWSKNPWRFAGLRHGPVDIQAGRNPGSSVRLEGLRPSSSSLFPAELNGYSRLLMWQDQHNSYVWYRQDARLDLACGGQDSPCRNTPDHPEAPAFSVWISPNTGYNGGFYQPRGAWMRLQGDGMVPFFPFLVTGAILATGNN